MSSELSLPRTAVPADIVDPVKKARAELVAALAAIEDKANVPRRLGRVVDDVADRARDLQRENPAAVAVAVVSGAVAVGALVWWGVRAFTRS